jgi:glycine cleavage system H protein
MEGHFVNFFVVDSVMTFELDALSVKEKGGLIFVDLCKVGHRARSGERIGVLEFLKVVLEIESPVNGEVLSINNDLVAAPEYLGTDAGIGTWLLKMKVED